MKDHQTLLTTITKSVIWQAFWQGQLAAVLIEKDGVVNEKLPHHGGLLSGSFNPLHEGHRQLATVAAEILSAPTTFELSITNVDKPPLSEAEVLRRVTQFLNYENIAISRAATFLTKAELFNGTTFIVGFDTAERTLSLNYYVDQAEMDRALGEIAAAHCQFLVACRLQKDGVKTIEDLQLPTAFPTLFRGIPAERFRVDLSSTFLRQREAEIGQRSS